MMDHATTIPQKTMTIGLPLLFGITAFFIVIGPRTLDPTNIAWLAQSGEDSITYYLSWLFFRNTSWSFPIGLNPMYGLELSNSIVYSDSNPLLAFLFKPFSPLLPATFQYFGIWLLICLTLQAWFGWKLVGLFSNNIAICLLATGFFVFAPPMMLRLATHFNLAGHFLLLAAFYLALHPTLHCRKLAWGALLSISALVHAYLLAMGGFIWLADLTWKTIQKKQTVRTTLLELSLIGVLLGIVCWQVGFFSIHSSIGSTGFGDYKMNLLSMFDANGWSYLLANIPKTHHPHESFHYLGLGSLFLLLCALPIMWLKRDHLNRIIRRFPMLLVALIVLTLFALSHKISIGLFNYEYPLPQKALDIANTFRASSRMFWPVYYAILLGILFLIVRGYRQSMAILILGLALIIQITDTSIGWLQIRKTFMTTPQSSWETPLVDPFWKTAALHYKKVRLIPPQNNVPRWFHLATYAGTHGLATDAVYLARIDASAQQQAQHNAMKALTDGQYDQGSLYILDDRSVRQAIFNIDRTADLLAHIDGLFVLAPGWKQYDHGFDSLHEVTLASLFHSPLLKIGEKVFFDNQSKTGLPFLGTGWSLPESWGVWSQGKQAQIVIPITQSIHTIQIEARALINPVHPEQTVSIKLNKKEVFTTTLTESTATLIDIHIPPAIQQEITEHGLLQLQFEFHNAVSPEDIGIGPDTRTLALGLQTMIVY